MLFFTSIVVISLTTVVCVCQESALSKTIASAKTRLFASLIPTAFSRNVSERCRNDSLAYLDSILRLNEEWAWKMLYSSAKLSDINLSANKQAMGHFDQCLSAAGPSFEGKFCTSYLISNNSDLLIQFLRNSAFSRLDDSVPRAATIPNLTAPTHFLHPSLSLCIPSSCKASDLGIALAVEMLERNNFDNKISFSVGIEDNFCYTKSQAVTLDITEIVIGTIFSALSAVAVSGTCIEIWKMYSYQERKTLEVASEESVWIRILLCFSFVKNGRKLFSRKSKWVEQHSVINDDRASPELFCVHGIRFILMFWIILCHSWVNGMIQYNQNLEGLREACEKWYWQIVANGTVAVDGFFLLSGMLVSYNLLRYLDESKGKFNILKYYFHRYFRLIPVYIAVFAFVSTLFSHLSSGPHWFIVKQMSANCRRVWWQHILFINNFIPKGANEQCMTETWYLGADFQLFLVSPFLIYPIWRHKMKGCILLFIVNGAAIVANLAFFAKTNIPPTSMMTRPLSSARSLIEFWSYYYPQPWFRAPPYFVGIFLGFLIYSKQNQTIRISKFTLALAWISSLVTMLLVIYGLSPYLDESTVPSIVPAVAILYGSLHRFAFAAALAWVIFACILGYGGIVNSILSCSFFKPLATLSYCIYLCHYNVILAYYGQTRQSSYYTATEQFYLVCGNLAISLMMALIFGIVIELPFNNLEKIFFSRSNVGPVKSDTTGEKKVDGKINCAFILK